jgi:hypothetical protein
MNPPGAPAATVRETHEPNLPDAGVAPRRLGGRVALYLVGVAALGVLVASSGAVS